MSGVARFWLSVEFHNKIVGKRLGIQTSPAQINVPGFGQCSKPVTQKAIISFKSRVSDYSRAVSMLVTDSITGLIPHEDVNVDH